ncbi:hypothetical protein ENBRE01_0762 [Enteropsectra breve]|nr:hypothetical protein ENBRE01_0762 [Enteropsectra breve]
MDSNDFFEHLAPEKKKVVTAAFNAVYNNEMSTAEFIKVCENILNEDEFDAIFNKAQNASGSQHSAGSKKDEIKTEHIEDIMQYSGIDLKEEANMITKEAEYNISVGSYSDVDRNNQIDSLLNPSLFREYVEKLCYSKGVEITDEAFVFMFHVLKRKLTDFVEKMAEACSVRTEAGLQDFSFRIDNEISKQLWYLNDIEKQKLDRLMLKKDDDQKKRKVIQEREDLLIKKRQSNSVAMAAMGLKAKSWMNISSNSKEDEENKFTSLYAPFDEKAFDDKINNRVITMKDFIYVLEKDKRYNKSVFLIQHYFK